MTSLRDLLHAVLSWLQAALAAWRLPARTTSRPAQGPAHPWHHLHVRALRPPARPPAPDAPARPPRVAPPPHILALLASAPAIEPEFAHLRRPAPTLLAPRRAAPARVRIYAPAPPRPAPPARPPRPRGASWARRLARAWDAARARLAAGPPPAAGRRQVVRA